MATERVLVDSNVLIDIIHGDPVWHEKSSAALTDAANNAVLVINPLVYAEVSVGFAHREMLDRSLPPDLLHREPLPYDAAFLAGKCFLAYRRAGGTKTSPLPDFYIGAHAAVAGYRLLTRDTRRYGTYFPHLTILTP